MGEKKPNLKIVTKVGTKTTLKVDIDPNDQKRYIMDGENRIRGPILKILEKIN